MTSFLFSYSQGTDAYIPLAQTWISILLAVYGGTLLIGSRTSFFLVSSCPPLTGP